MLFQLLRCAAIRRVVQARQTVNSIPMKSYACVMLNGANGMVIRMHQENRQNHNDPDALVALLSNQYVPLREVILPNGSVLIVLCQERT